MLPSFLKQNLIIFSRSNIQYALCYNLKMSAHNIMYIVHIIVNDEDQRWYSINDDQNKSERGNSIRNDFKILTGLYYFYFNYSHILRLHILKRERNWYELTGFYST